MGGVKVELVRRVSPHAGARQVTSCCVRASRRARLTKGSRAVVCDIYTHPLGGDAAGNPKERLCFDLVQRFAC